ncbi:hypothetical protein [Pseudomonas sp. Marseille-QA0892]
MARAYFAPILTAYARRHPNVDVTVVSGSSVDLMSDSSRGLVDLTISQCPERRVWVNASVWSRWSG